jgi:hypothetical protein
VITTDLKEQLVITTDLKEQLAITTDLKSFALQFVFFSSIVRVFKSRRIKWPGESRMGDPDVAIDCSNTDGVICS